MSIHHEVTIHCDTCGHWEYGDGESTARRRKRGWRIWKDDEGFLNHSCPTCTRKAGAS